MGILKNLYHEAYEFWTGFDLDHPLHDHAGFGNLEEVQKLVPRIKSKEIDINGYNKGGVLALSQCFFDAQFCANIQRRFEIGILFLELGAKPYLPTLRGKQTLLHDNIKEKCIGTQRLLLWYDPDYENITDINNVTAAHKLDQKGFEEYKKVIEETAKDVRAVKQLLAEAEDLKERLDFLKAAEKYNQAAAIFKKQGEIEKTLPYLVVYEESRAILINFYRRKVFQCYQGVEECYAGLILTPEIKQAHLEVLKFLANEATALKLGIDEAIAYAKKIAELTLEVKANQFDPIQHSAAQLNGKMNKDPKTKEEAEKVSDVDNEFTPLLILQKEKKGMKQAAAETFHSAPLPQLRKRTITSLNAMNPLKK